MDALNYAALRNTMRRTIEMNRVRMPSLKRGVRRSRREISAPKQTAYAERQPNQGRGSDKWRRSARN